MFQRIQCLCFAATICTCFTAFLVQAAPVLAQAPGTGVAVDPDGDTFGTREKKYDLTLLGAHIAGDELVVTIVVAGEIVSVGEDLENGIVGMIELDTDRNPSTGLAGGLVLGRFCPGASDLGAEAAITFGFPDAQAAEQAAAIFDVSRQEPGQPPSTPVGEGTYSLSGSSIVIRAPLALLGEDDGELDLRVGIGTQAEPTDCGPDGVLLAAAPGTRPFVRGDCAGDGRISDAVHDALFLLEYLFSGGAEPPCLAACDANADGKLSSQVADAMVILLHGLAGGPAPLSVFPACGPGSLPEDLSLGCQHSPATCGG